MIKTLLGQVKQYKKGFTAHSVFYGAGSIDGGAHSFCYGKDNR